AVAILRSRAAAPKGFPDRIHCGPRALSRVALLAALHPVSGRRGGRLAGAERLPRAVSGGLGLALLEIVSRKDVGRGARLVGLDDGVVRDQLVAARRLGVSLRGALGRPRDGLGPFPLRLSLESAGRLPTSHAAANSDCVDHRCLRRWLPRGLVFGVAGLCISARRSAADVTRGLGGGTPPSPDRLAGS